MVNGNRRRLFKSSTAICACLIVAFAGTAQSTIVNLRPRLYVSDSGDYGFKLIPQKDGAPVGLLFGVNEDGTDRVLWKRRLVNFPNAIFIHNGYFPDARAPKGEQQSILATVDSISSAGYDHSVVIYNAEGMTVGDFDLEDLLSPQEVANYTTPHRRQPNVAQLFANYPSREWATGTKFVFWTKLVDDKTYVPVFRITFKWGKTVDIDATTGKIEVTYKQ